MAFFWIIAGVVYVLYKLHEEEKIFNKTTLILLGVVFAWALVPWIITYYIWGNTVATIVSAVTFGLPMLCIAICGIIFNIPKNSRKARTINLGYEPSSIVVNLQDEFKKNGYSISREDVEYIVRHPATPLNYEGATIQKCYIWLCKEKTWELNKLSKAQIENIVCVPIESIPLDPNLPPVDAKLKRMVMVKNYILKNNGLSYRALSDTDNLRIHNTYLVEDMYTTVFDEFIKNYLSEHH